VTGLQRISSGGPWEDHIGYSRAVQAGPFVFVSGCTSTIDGQVRHEGDPYNQTLTAFGVAAKALEQLGLTLADTVQTRMYLVHARDSADVGRAHSELFDAVRPAATMVEVAGLIDPQMLVEIEVVAYRGETVTTTEAGA
jgi:enamine deaminase RidA (YjgF/YER057c/UK114 family)